jgi:hypothetical protein
MENDESQIITGWNGVYIENIEMIPMLYSILEMM